MSEDPGEWPTTRGMPEAKRRLATYKTVVAGDAEALARAVNALLVDDWRPLGGVAVCYEPPTWSHGCKDCQCNGDVGGSWTWTQAMVRFAGPQP